MNAVCKSCMKAVDGHDVLQCDSCSGCVHVSCLRAVPEGGMLAGDVFFDFSCENCSSRNQEVFKRKKLQWVMIVVITLHNLSKFSVSNQGYFHFRSHIANFIDKHWTKLFSNVAKRKRKNLLGTIAGVLSQHSPETFLSGTDEIGSIGWWKMTKNLSPLEFEKNVKNKAKRGVESDCDNFKVEEPEAKRIKTEEVSEPESTVAEENVKLEIEEETKPAHMTMSIKLEPLTTSTKVISTNSSDNEIYQKLKSIFENSDLDVPSWVRRYYRKLHINKIKLKGHIKPPTTLKNNDSPLGIYCKASNQSQRLLLAGPSSHHCFQSPYTSNLLHSFIYRDKKMSPRWLKLMCELKHKVTGNIPERSSVDFCYASAHHISAVNSLLQETFWPGIDMSEALSYPDFTVVALYKKLVIGCAFLVPDACHNEAYISFLAVRPGWDRSGIASFMLYHLTQTSLGKDMTLHVSASNPAICLYQKFGFKTEELALNFYEKFLPPDSTHSPHALFLRLTR